MNKIIKDLSCINYPLSIPSEWSILSQSIIEEESIHCIFYIRGVDCELSDGCDVLQEMEVFFMGFPAGGMVVVEKSAVACVVMLLLGGSVA